MEEIPRQAIVADIGGTNARFACVDLENPILNEMALSKIAVYPCSNFKDLETAVRFYQREHALLVVKHVAIAVASLVAGDVVTMTNLSWQFSISELKHRLGLLDLHVLNDFVAQAMSLPFLSEHEKIQIGSGRVDARHNRVILGPGTGLGVAYLVPTEQGMTPIASEGGHIEWAPYTDQEWFIKQFLVKQYHHVSHERLLSGPGLENLYVALATFRGQNVDFLSAVEITDRALSQSCPLAVATVQQFLACLGSIAADCAFTLNTLGGVYLTGGIVPKLLPLIEGSEFRARFEMKGRHSSFKEQSIATFVLAVLWPGLIGAAGYIKQKIKGIAYDFA
ncbi:MAG: glucokinase [Legionellales bacterium RIFCSPHIGHO2_12_FULL_42_9]|nr:MAG: glucokinase [Legionellales bacterium RIFCSPHIGHO2_12_FULL_42_9]